MCILTRKFKVQQISYKKILEIHYIQVFCSSIVLQHIPQGVKKHCMMSPCIANMHKEHFPLEKNLAAVSTLSLYMK